MNRAAFVRDFKLHASRESADEISIDNFYNLPSVVIKNDFQYMADILQRVLTADSSQTAHGTSNKLEFQAGHITSLRVRRFVLH
jgi:hypothetical protein